MLIPNSDHRPEAYTEMKEKYRPSHADFTYQTKFGRRNHEGGGRSSARETAGRVAAGAIARKILQQGAGIEIRAYVSQVHDIEMSSLEALPSSCRRDANPVRCPDADAAAQMEKRILEARKSGDSVGGVILCRVQNLLVGLGAPVSDRLEADLAKAMLSSCKQGLWKLGAGFQEHVLKVVSIMIFLRSVRVAYELVTNRSGGVQGGISNGELYFRTAFKPTATVLQEQQTVDLEGNETS